MRAAVFAAGHDQRHTAVRLLPKRDAERALASGRKAVLQRIEPGLDGFDRMFLTRRPVDMMALQSGPTVFTWRKTVSPSLQPSE